MPILTRGIDVSRTLACDITITDSGSGPCYCEGSVQHLSQTARWSASFATVSGTRYCTLTLNGVSKGTFAVTGGTYTGTVTIDADLEKMVSLPYPIGVSADFYERLKPGGTHTATIELFGYTQTNTTTASGVGIPGVTNSLVVDTSGRVGDGFGSAGGAISCEVVFTSLPAPIDRPTLTGGDSGTYLQSGAYTFTYSTSAESSETRTFFSITRGTSTSPITGLPRGGTFVSASSRLGATPVREATVDVRVARGEIASVAAGTLQLTGLSPIAFTGTHQESISRSSGFNAITWWTGGNAVSTPVPSRLTAEVYLTEWGGRDGPIRLEFMGWLWDALTLTHHTPARIDEGNTLSPSSPNASLYTGAFSGSWSAGGGGSVSTSGGILTLTGGSGKTLTRAFTSRDLSFMGSWVRMRIRMRCDQAPHTIRVRANQQTTTAAGVRENKHWDITTGAANTWTTLDLDMAAEHNGPTVSMSEQGGDYGGIYATQLVFESLGAGTYDIDWIELDCPEGELVHVRYAQGVPLYGMSQGVCTLRVAPQGTTTIGDIVAWINNPTTGAPLAPLYPIGWQAAASSPYASEGAEPWALSKIQMDNQSATLLASLTYEANAWGVQFGTGAVVPGDPIRAQTKVFAVGWDWPDTDLFDLGGDPGDGLYLGAGTLYGGGYWGRVLNASRAPKSGSTVEAFYDPGAVSLGTDTSDALGYYETGSPLAGREPANAKLQGTSPLLRTYRNAAPTGRERITFCDTSPTGTGDAVDLACSPTGRLTRAYADSGQVIVETRESDGESVWTRILSGVSGSRPCIRYDWQGTQSLLLLAFEDGGASKFSYSADEGRTWAVATTIAPTGSHPEICPDQTGKRHLFYYRSSAIYTKIYDQVGNNLLGETTVVASGVADDSIAASEDIDTQRIVVVYKNTSGAIITVESSDGGVTFS